MADFVSLVLGEGEKITDCLNLPITIFDICHGGLPGTSIVTSTYRVRLLYLCTLE